MRIAVIHSRYASAQPSGENAVVDEQASILEAAGHEVRVLSRSTDDVVDERGYRVRAATAVATGFGPSPEPELNAFRPDVIHLHNTFPNYGTKWLARWGHRTVTTLHNYRTLCSAGTFFRSGAPCTKCLTTPALPAIRHRCYRDSVVQTLPLAIGTHPRGGLRPILRESARLITLNQSMAQIVSTAAGRSVDVVPNFVAEASDIPPARKGEWAFVGRITPEKGLADLLSNWPSCKNLHIYGDGPQRESLLMQHGSNPALVWHGNVPRAELLGRLGGYEGLAVPSLWTEGFPTVLMEALARGVPLAVSGHVAAAKELIEARVAVELPTAKERKAETVSALAQVADGGEAMRSRCVIHHKANFSPAKWRDRMTGIYEQVVIKAAD